MKRAIVIGAGPAGSTAAIHLRRAGCSVKIFEKDHFPRRKLCGGFLSAEAVDELREFGLLDELFKGGATAVNHVLVSHGRQSVKVPLSRPGLSVMREVLDGVLLAHACGLGAELEATVFKGREKQDLLFIASGRSIEPEADGWYGFQAFFDTPRNPKFDAIELHLAQGGYVGVVKQGPAVLNVCGFIRHSVLRRYGPDLDILMGRFMLKNSALAERMEGSKRIASWRGVGPVRMGVRQLMDGTGTAFYIGDAACVVDPYAGAGMTAAMIGAKLAVQAALSSEQDPRDRYARSWKNTFNHSVRNGQWIRHCVTASWSQSVVTALFRLSPSLLSFAVQTTRPRVAG